jgi:hypothetical protein
MRAALCTRVRRPTAGVAAAGAAARAGGAIEPCGRAPALERSHGGAALQAVGSTRPPGVPRHGSARGGAQRGAVVHAKQWVLSVACTCVCVWSRVHRLQLLSRGELPAPYAAGLAHTHWPGRAQVVHDAAAAEPGAPLADSAQLTFYLDGAHTGESAATCADWFMEASAAAATPSATPRRVLVFNCMKARRHSPLAAATGGTCTCRHVAHAHAPRAADAPTAGARAASPAAATRLSCCTTWCARAQRSCHLRVALCAARWASMRMRAL